MTPAETFVGTRPGDCRRPLTAPKAPPMDGGLGVVLAPARSDEVGRAKLDQVRTNGASASERVSATC